MYMHVDPAQPNLDFMITTETLVFEAGSAIGTSLPFNVPIVDDLIIENPEPFGLQLPLRGMPELLLILGLESPMELSSS